MGLSLNLNLDSFRAMMGNKNYGDVCLSDKGGLQIINNHYLQRAHNINKRVVSNNENHLIRVAFLASLSDKVDGNTFRVIRAKLGIAGEFDGNSNLEVYDTPLSRREIKEVLDMVDDHQEKMAGLCGNGIAKAIRDDGETVISGLVKIYNASAMPADKINLTAGKLKTILLRHGRELMVAAGVEDKKGGNATQLIIEKVRSYLKNERFGGNFGVFGKSVWRSEGEKKFLGEVDFNLKWKTLSQFGMAPEVYAGIKDRYTMNLGVKDFMPTNFTTLEGEPERQQEIVAECNRCGSDQIGSEKCKTLFGMISDNLIGTATSNMTRNPIDVTIGTVKHDDFEAYYGSGSKVGQVPRPNHEFVERPDATEASIKELNAGRIRDIYKEICGLSKEITVDQFIAAAKILNQRVYNLPKTFGYAFDAYEDIRATVTAEDDKIKVSLVWRGTNGKKGKNNLDPVPMSFSYVVNREGIVQVQSLNIG